MQPRSCPDLVSLMSHTDLPDPNNAIDVADTADIADIAEFADDSDASPYPHVALEEVVAFVAAAQADPAQHVAFLNTGEATIRAEIQDAFGPAWLERTVFAFEGGALIGCALIDFDTALRRVWLHGPFVRSPDAAHWAFIADELWAEARLRLSGLLAALAGSAEPASTDDFQVDLFVDGRNTNIAAFGARHGFERRDQTAIMVLTREAWQAATVGRPSTPQTPAPFTVRPADPGQPAEAEGFTRLHDALFPGTYAPADSILAALTGLATHVPPAGETPDKMPAQLFVALPAEPGAAPSILGYAWVEVEPDGNAAYLHYLGVAEEARRQGVGRALLSAACGWAFSQPAHPTIGQVNLTVTAANESALGLYRGLGFAVERMAVGFRLGVP